MAVSSRQDDELHFALLQERCAGDSTYTIAERHSLRRAYVQTVTMRIRKADEAESGEDVGGAYW